MDNAPPSPGTPLLTYSPPPSCHQTEISSAFGPCVHLFELTLISHLVFYSKGYQTVSVKSQRASILGFLGHTLSYRSVKTALDRM